jgi:hypothetical protein
MVFDIFNTDGLGDVMTVNLPTSRISKSSAGDSLPHSNASVSRFFKTALSDGSRSPDRQRRQPAPHP